MSLIDHLWFFFTWLALARFIQACADRPMGMANGEIKDWQISASSTNHFEWDQSCHEKFSRLYAQQGKAWCPKHRSDSEWLQIDLGVASTITGVITQGRSGKREWVVSYMVSFSTDAFQWQYVTDRYGNQRIFSGNINDHAIKHNYFDQSISARFVRFHIVQWNKYPSMRVELVGCMECNQPLGLPPYGKIKASSCLGQKFKQTCQPNDGFLMSNRGWSPIRRYEKNEWLELDIGHPTLITGLVSKGRNDAKKNHWVTKYKVSFSNDTVLWTYYKDANHLEAKIFGANADKQMERTHYLNNPFWARYVRFYPIEWNEQIGMRVGLIGCPFEGQCSEGYFRVNDNSNCVENMAYRKDIWVLGGKSRGDGLWYSRNNSWSLRPFRSPLLFNEKFAGKDGHPFYAVDGNDDSMLQKCAIISNHNNERPTLVIDLGKMVNVGGVVLKTWQGRMKNETIFENSTFSYRDYMYGLDKYLVFVDKRPMNVPIVGGDAQNKTKRLIGGDDASGFDSLLIRNLRTRGNAFFASSKPKFSENNLCNYVSRSNYAIFSPQIHLQCSQPLQGRYVFVQAMGRSNRRNGRRLFDAVLCEIQVYEI